MRGTRYLAHMNMPCSSKPYVAESSRQHKGVCHQHVCHAWQQAICGRVQQAAQRRVASACVPCMAVWKPVNMQHCRGSLLMVALT